MLPDISHTNRRKDTCRYSVVFGPEFWYPMMVSRSHCRHTVDRWGSDHGSVWAWNHYSPIAFTPVLLATSRAFVACFSLSWWFLLAINIPFNPIVWVIKPYQLILSHVFSWFPDKSPAVFGRTTLPLEVPRPASDSNARMQELRRRDAGIHVDWIFTGWWFGTWLLFFHILGIVTRPVYVTIRYR